MKKRLKITWGLLDSCHLLFGYVEMSTEPRLKQNIYITVLRDCSKIQIHQMKVYLAILIFLSHFCVK